MKTKRMLMGLLAFETVLFALMAWCKPLGFDELFTVMISDFISWSELHHARLEGGDFNPPLPYLLIRAVRFLGGDHALWFRLPFMLGFLAMPCFVFAYVRRRADEVTALLAAVLALAPFKYAVEARAYAVVLMCAAAAFHFWTRASEPDRRPWHVAAFAASLWAAMASHYYAVFLLFPFALGECSKCWKRKRLDFPIVGNMALAVTPILLTLDVLMQARTFSTNYYDVLRPSSLVHGYIYLGYRPMAAIVFASVFLLLAVRVRVWRTQGEGRPFVPPHEAWVLAGFCALPLAGVIVAYAVTGIFTARHYLSATLGFVIAGAWAARFVLRGRIPEMGCMIAVMLLGTIALQVQALHHYREERAAGRKVVEEVTQLHSAKPVVLRAPGGFIQLAYYLPENDRSRLYYAPTTTANEQRVTGERSLLSLASIKGFRVIDEDKLEDVFPDGYYRLQLERFGRERSWSEYPERVRDETDE